MSAPVSHHPLVVNTQDGSCWIRRAVSRDGRGLYALAGSVAGVPDEVLVALADLAELGIAGSAFALPMPAGSEPSPLERKYIFDTAELKRERDALRARVAELEAKVLLLNTLRGDVALLVERERGFGEECVDIDDVEAALALGSDEVVEADGITRRIAPTQALREDDPAEETARRSVDAQFPKVAEFLRETGGAS